MEAHSNLGIQVASTRAELISVLRSGGCTLREADIDFKLLWICDLQDLVSAQYHQQVCDLWNQFWIYLWQYRISCGHNTGHGPWLPKPVEYFRHPHHFVCAQCGFVKVIQPGSLP
jgi:hypothetical protein